MITATAELTHPTVRSLDGFVERLEQALRAEPQLAGRLALADTSVELRLRGSRATAIHAVLSSGGVRFAAGPGGDAEVELDLDRYEFDRFCAGQALLPTAIVSGKADYRGPVRKFLRVAPIVRHLIERAPGVAPRFAEYAGGARAPAAVTERSLADLWAIECRGVHKRFGADRVLEGVDLGIPEGAITVVLGPSGTGKSVLLKHMIGLLFPDQGEVLSHGRPLSHMKLSELLALRRRLGILFQDGALFSSMTVYDNVAFPLRQHTDLTEREIAEIVQIRLADVGLAGETTAMPSQLSGGMRKRVGLARAMVFEPEVVMLDEPDSGLDPVRTALLCDLILKLHGEYGGTHIVVTHDIATAKRIGEYLAVLWNGQIIEAGPADALFNSTNPFVRQFLSAGLSGPLGMD